MPPNRSPRILIIGSGFSGVAMAIELRSRGITDIVLLERAVSLGGTWRDNAYPGCACDVESTLYSLAVAPNPDWSRSFAPRSEIWAYLTRVATEQGVAPLIHFNEEVTGARWDDSAKRWTVTSTSGDWSAQAVVLANGALSDPVIPSFPGAEDFRGPIFHTARWDASANVDGKRVAVVGTGASAIQVIPAIQARVQTLVVVQRTPAWVIPRRDGAIPAWRRALHRRFPFTQRLVRLQQHLFHELLLFYPFRHRIGRGIVERLLARHLKQQVRDPALRRALAPDYHIGCKRLLLSDDYYLAMTQPNVTLVSSAVTRVTVRGVVTADGSEHEVDAIILATGFRVTDPILAPVTVGRNGRSLADVWMGSPKAYMSTTVAGFPNLFIVGGPNTGLGHSSVIMMFEAQCAHIANLLAQLDARGARTVEPTTDAQARYVRWMDESLATTVWNSGCTSWYLDRTGRNSTLWPFGIGKFRRTLARVREGDYAFGA